MLEKFHIWLPWMAVGVVAVVVIAIIAIIALAGDYVGEPSGMNVTAECIYIDSELWCKTP